MARKAFISSTFEDLKEHRSHVITALRKAGIHVDPMEEWTAAADEPKVFSTRRMHECDLCVLLVARRRGYVPPNEQLSITQMEYQYAVSNNITMLVFLLRDEALWHRRYDDLDGDPALRAWRQALCERHGIAFFDHTPESIDIASAISRWSIEAKALTPQTCPFTVTWYTFAPFCPGTATMPGELLPGLSAKTQNADAIQYGSDDPTVLLNWYSYGGATWVLTRRLEFSSIAELAVDRERLYYEILQGNHSIRCLTSRLHEHVFAGVPGAEQLQSPIGYALSLVVVDRLGWVEEYVENALKLLSCPNLVLGYATGQDTGQKGVVSVEAAMADREVQLLTRGITQCDFLPFSLAGALSGYASWAGVATYFLSAQRAALEAEFVRYQTQLQALWWYLHHETALIDKGVVCEITPEVRRLIRRQSRQLLNVGPTEATPLRLFKEAVVKTSRIEQLWNDFEGAL